jgi:hypothetical protein
VKDVMGTVRFRYNLHYRRNIAAFINKCQDRLVPTQLFAKPLSKPFGDITSFVLGQFSHSLCIFKS